MKKPSEYEQEINRMTAMERILIAAVLIVFFFLFVIISRDMETQETKSSQVKQEETR